MSKVLVIADPHVAVPPLHYGGAERTIAYLCEQLGRQNWTVNLMANSDSMKPTGRLLPHTPATGNVLQRGLTKLKFQVKSLLAARQVDVVINFGRVDYTKSILSYTDKPIIFAFQNPVSQVDIDYVLENRRNKVRFIGVSHSQVEGIQPSELVDVVNNVSDVGEMKFGEKAATPAYFAFLGRLTANKGVHLAIAAAKQAGVRLKIAGTLSDREPGAREYYETQVLPHLDEKITYVGPVDNRQKSELLSQASGLLFPIQWKEPCALVIPESLACGCPVIGWRNGCVPETIQHGVTGFVVDSIDAMVDAIHQVGSINRDACRVDALTRYTPQVLLSGFLQSIQKVM